MLLGFDMPLQVFWSFEVHHHSRTQTEDPEVVALAQLLAFSRWIRSSEEGVTCLAEVDSMGSNVGQ